MPISDEITKALASIEPSATAEYIIAAGGIKKLYDDLASPTVKKAGILGAKCFSALTAGINLWAEKRLKRFQALQDDVVQKLNNVNPDDIVAPPEYITVPALNAYMYSMDEKMLRKMYANLISKAMLKIYNQKIHPSFVTIVQNLTPSEGILIEYISKLSNMPLAETHWVRVKDGSYITHIKDIYVCPYPAKYNNETPINVSKSNSIFVPQFTNYGLGNPIYLSNLVRLGLVMLSYSTRLREEHYTIFNNLPNVLEDKRQCEINRQEFKLLKGRVTITPLGKSFVNICVE